MTRYDDSNAPQGTPVPGGIPAPPGQPQMSIGPPPAAPPPGVHGDLPTGGACSGNANKKLPVIAGLIIAAFAARAGGAGALVLLSGPEELSMNDYAEKVCDEVIEAIVKERNDLLESNDYEKRVGEEDVDNEKEAQEAIDLVKQDLDFRVEFIDAIDSFNGGQVVRGSDGEELQEQLSDYVDDVRGDLEDAREHVEQADPADEEDVFDDLNEVYGELNPPDIYGDDRDPGYDLANELVHADESCNLFGTGEEQAACDTERAMLITAWNAAITSNKVNVESETYRDYLNDPDEIKYFSDPTNGGAVRTVTTVVNATPADCPSITDDELHDM